MEPKEWMEEIKKGIEYREKFGRDRDWPRYWRYYRGDFGDDENTLPVNMIFTLARSLVPRIYFRNPAVILTPMRPGFMVQSRVLEQVDNILIREMKVKQAIKSACLDAFLYGTGIIKRGYDSEFGYTPEDAELDVDDLLETETGEIRGGDERIEYDNFVRQGYPWVRRIHPNTFVVPWGARDLQSSPWCAHKVIRHIDDVKADPKYKNTEDLGATLTHVPVTNDKTEGGRLYEPTAKSEYVELWEIYDGKHNRVYVIAEGHDQFLRDEPDVLSHRGYPFHPIIFNPDEDHFWGISDAHNIEGLQLELNEIKTQSQQDRRVSLLRFLYNADLIDEDEIDKFLSGERAGIGIKIKGDPGRAIMPLQSYVPPDRVMSENQVMQNIREVFGFSRNQMGEFDRATRRTATEAAIVDQASNLRTDERRDIVADALTDIIEATNEVIFDNWMEGHVASIVGPNGAKYWVEFTGDELRGEYLYRVDPDAALPVSAQVRREEAMQLLQMVIQLAQHVPNINIEPLLRHLLRQFEGIDVQEIFPDPAEDAMGEEVGMNQLVMQLSGGMPEAPPMDLSGLMQMMGGGG